MVRRATLVTEVPFSNRPSYLSLHLPPLLQIPRLLSAQHGAVAVPGLSRPSATTAGSMEALSRASQGQLLSVVGDPSPQTA